MRVYQIYSGTNVHSKFYGYIIDFYSNLCMDHHFSCQRHRHNCHRNYCRTCHACFLGLCLDFDHGLGVGQQIYVRLAA